MAELHRKKKETYFSFLPKDITTMIDAMGRPIEKGSLRVLNQEKFTNFFLSAGQNLIVSTDTGVMDKHVYQSIPELTRLRVSSKNLGINLRGPEDTVNMYSDGDFIYLGDQVYQISITADQPTMVVFNPDVSLFTIRFTAKRLCRGANGYIYFIYQHQLYRFHLSTPTMVKPLICPNEQNKIDWFASSLMYNRLVFGGNGVSRWDLDSNEITSLQSNEPFIVDPMTCNIYTMIRTDQDFKLVGEDNQIVLEIPFTSSTDIFIKGVITLSGHLVLQMLNPMTTVYVYG